jgi:hypothetical protein
MVRLRVQFQLLLLAWRRGWENGGKKVLVFVTSYFHPILKFADPGSPPLRLVYTICETRAKLVRLKELWRKRYDQFKIEFITDDILVTHY